MWYLSPKICTKRTFKWSCCVSSWKKKPFECFTCNSKFAENGKLYRHILSVHEGRKPFECKTCDSRFFEKNPLNWHIAGVHNGQKSYECIACKENFAYKSYLNTHMTLVHGWTQLQPTWVTITLELPWKITSLLFMKENSLLNVNFVTK